MEMYVSALFSILSSLCIMPFTFYPIGESNGGMGRGVHLGLIALHLVSPLFARAQLAESPKSTVSRFIRPISLCDDSIKYIREIPPAPTPVYLRISANIFAPSWRAE